MKIKIADNSREVGNQMTRFLILARNRGPAMAAIAGQMYAAVADNFRAEGRPKWAPLSKNTIAARALKKQSGKIGQASGQMAGSVQPFSNANKAGVGTNVPYAPFFQFGTRPHVIRAKKKQRLAIPTAGGMVYRKVVNHPGTKPRPFLQLADLDREIILELMKRHLAGTL